MGCVVISGTRYIGFALNPVSAKTIQRVVPFVFLKNSPRNVISFIRYIRNSLYPVCVKSGVGCVIVQGNSLLLKGSVDCQN